MDVNEREHIRNTIRNFEGDRLREDIRAAVLYALDQVAHTYGLEHGWEDKDLPSLFRGLDQQAEKLFNRLQKQKASQ